MSKEMTPNMLAALDEERQFQDQHRKNKVRRVKIEKVNQAWLVRFLPVGLGSRNLWYVRQGQHWLNKQPIFCPRCVSPDFGGDPSAPCPVCDLADILNAESNDEVSKFGFKLRSNLTYLTYCLVYQVDPGRGETEDMPESEILKPWEFQHYQSSFDDLMNYFRRGVTNARPYSVLDLERGNDFWATRTTKGTHLDRQDPAPIFEKDAAYEGKLDTIFNSIAQPKIKLPTDKELETFARKAEAAAYGEVEERPSRGGGRSNDVDENDEPQERPGRRTSSARPGRRMAAEPAAEEPPAEDDQIPGAEVPPRATRPAATAPARAAAAAAAAAPARAAAPAAARPAATTARPATATAARPAATAARPAATAARPAAATATRPGTATRPAAAARPVMRPAAAAAAESSVDPEEDPGIAEEATDQAPPAEELPPEEAPADGEPAAEEGQGEEAPAEQEEAPPAPVTRQNHAAPTANTGLRQRLLNRVQKA